MSSHSGWFFRVTAVVERYSGPEPPAGVTEVRVVREVQALSWGDAIEQATEELLSDLARLMGGVVGSRITRVEVEALP